MISEHDLCPVCGFSHISYSWVCQGWNGNVQIVMMLAGFHLLYVGLMQWRKDKQRTTFISHFHLGGPCATWTCCRISYWWSECFQSILQISDDFPGRNVPWLQSFDWSSAPNCYTVYVQPVEQNWDCHKKSSALGKDTNSNDECQCMSPLMCYTTLII